MSRVEMLDAGQLREVLASERRGVLVDFWSPWCAPCRVLKPHLERMAAAREGAWRFVAVDTEAEPALAEAFEVKSLPTLILFREGRESHRFTGTAMLSAIEQKLDETGPVG